MDPDTIPLQRMQKATIYLSITLAVRNALTVNAAMPETTLCLTPADIHESVEYNGQMRKPASLLKLYNSLLL